VSTIKRIHITKLLWCLYAQKRYNSRYKDQVKHELGIHFMTLLQDNPGEPALELSFSLEPAHMLKNKYASMPVL